jgi:hypothetical protein
MIPELVRLRRENLKLEDNLGYIAEPSLKDPSNKKIKSRVGIKQVKVVILTQRFPAGAVQEKNMPKPLSTSVSERKIFL